MPIYVATILVKLEEETQEAADDVASRIAQRLCDDSFTDCARVEGVEELSEEDEEQFVWEVER